jgi:transcriptional regulator with XRE-family HTH domain
MQCFFVNREVISCLLWVYLLLCKVVKALVRIAMNLGARERIAAMVKQARGNRSYRAYGRLLGVAGTTVQGWENMQYVPGIDKLTTIAVDAGYTLTELFDSLEEKPLPAPASKDRLLQQMRQLTKKELVEVMEAGVKLLAAAS